MDGYSIPELIELLRTERGERVRLDAGFPPSLIVNGEWRRIEGPAVADASLEEILRTVANTTQMQAFGETGCVEVVVPFDGSRFLVRGLRAFGLCRLELERVPV